MAQAVVVEAVRTPIGRHNGALRDVRPDDLAALGVVESMSRAPYAIPKNPDGTMSHLTAWDTTLGWRFPNPKMKEKYGTESMGETAENLRLVGPKITREEQDRFALESHRRAIAAIESGRFSEEIAPVPVPQKKGGLALVTRDEHPRPDTSLEALAKLPPAFREGGTVTAGNSSGVNDGAAALLMMSDSKAKELGLHPTARVVASAAAGVEPRTMGLGPIPATRKALARAGVDVEDLGPIQLNEAFAIQSLLVMRELGFPPEITNVNGGAIALGHPLGCSGARVMTTLLHEMRRRAPRGKRPDHGLPTLCGGVGQGGATVVEWAGP